LKRDVKTGAPFSLTVPIDIRREDHESHKKPPKISKKEQENGKVLAEIEKINWLKNKSMLDLSELIAKHDKRQPELLAMLQPDLKSQLLNDPAVLKSFEQLERQDPINKRVGEVKDFIKAIKDKKYADKVFFSREDRDIV